MSNAPLVSAPSDESAAVVLSTRARVRAFFTRLLGPPLSTQDQEEHKIGAWRGVPALGLDGLGSSAYGPEAALSVLIPLGALGLAYIGPIMLLICALLTILYFSYRQTIATYPSGGGAYSVAKTNLGTQAALVAAAALTVDYVLNVAVGIAAGIGALVSAFPALQHYTLALCLATLALITICNLRGVRESSLLFGFPTYLFIGSMLLVLLLGTLKAVWSHGHPYPVVRPPAVSQAVAGVNPWLLMRAFASGCTAMTGVEAVSNGVTAFSKPVVKNARMTLTITVSVLIVFLVGIAHLAHIYGIGARSQNAPGYESVLSQLVGAIVGRGPMYYVAIGSLLTVLALSANTSFADFPRLCRVIAEDDYLPHGFANLGRRLVYSLGITILAILSGSLLIFFDGITDRLIPLFAVGAFLAFTLSQAGMVVHWRRAPGQGSGLAMWINAVGALATTLALLVIIAAKFMAGAWVTVLVMPCLLWLFHAIHAHYQRVNEQTARAQPMETSPLPELIVMVPIGGWNTVAEKAVRFGLRLSTRVEVLYISNDEEAATRMRRRWTDAVERPLQAAGATIPRLIIVISPYRLLYDPIIDCVKNLRKEHPGTYINVLIPELIHSRWVEYLLHNQRALGLKTLLLLQRDPFIVVTNVPWYLLESTDQRPP